MKNMKLLIIFGIVFGFVGINASEGDFERCLIAKKNLLRAVSGIDEKNLIFYLNNRNSLYVVADTWCQKVKYSEIYTSSDRDKAFHEELRRDLLNEKKTKDDCDKVRQTFILALSKTENKESQAMIAQVFKFSLHDCGYKLSCK